MIEQKCKEYAMQLGGNVRAYVEVHLLKDNVQLEYRCKWIRNVLKLAKNNIIYNGDDIRKYFCK